MAIMIREYIGTSDFYQDVKENTLQLSEADSTSQTIEELDPNSLMVQIEGIHAAPFATRNYTRYMPKCLKDSISSWTEPYKKPLIKHHNEKDGEIIGRIVKAEYKNKNTLSGTPAIVFTVNIPDQEAKENVKNGLYATTSIGVIAHDVRCSICGAQLCEGEECEHERGNVYDGEYCYWDVHKMEAKELSYVIVPSDMYSKTVSFYPVSEAKSATRQLKESFDKVKGEQSMDNQDTQKTIPETVDDTKVLQEMEQKVSELEEANKKLEAEKETAEKEIAELKENIATLEANLEEKIKSEESLQEKLQEESTMREQLESAIADAKENVKKSMIETVTVMRKALNRPVIDVQILESRTEDSIKDSIVDMQEEFAAKNFSLEESKVITSSVPNTVIDPTLTDVEENTNVNLKEEKVDLKKEFYSIFGDVVSVHKK